MVTVGAKTANPLASLPLSLLWLWGSLRSPPLEVSKWDPLFPPGACCCGWWVMGAFDNLSMKSQRFRGLILGLGFSLLFLQCFSIFSSCLYCLPCPTRHRALEEEYLLWRRLGENFHMIQNHEGHFHRSVLWEPGGRRVKAPKCAGFLCVHPPGVLGSWVHPHMASASHQNQHNTSCGPNAPGEQALAVTLWTHPSSRSQVEVLL
jgi:hypothetical protein